MIRFRVGQSWRRDPGPGAEPRDAFAFELDGVNLLPGAQDEPLLQVVGSLVEAVASLAGGSERSAQLSLDDVALEVCFWRRAGLEVEVAVVSLGQPPRPLQPVVVVELPALVEAAAACARAFLRELGPSRTGEEVLAIERQLRVLQGTVLGALDDLPSEPWTLSRSLEGLAFTLEDADGRTLAYGRRSRGGLPSLLLDGAVTGPGGARIEGLPFLTMLGLARAAAEGRARLAGQPVPAQAVFGAGLDLCLALRTRNPALASNPWLEALQGRCTTGLAALQAPVPDHAPASSASPRAPATLPLATAGQVRRLTLHARWSRPLALGEEGARLTLDRGRVVVASAHGLQAFSRRGEALLQRSGAQGLAARGLASLCATADRLLYFGDAGASASWVRDHDGTPLGQALELVDGVLVTTLAQRAAIGLDPVTGRELWRFAPPRTQRAWVSAAGARVLVATDGGVLHGLDAATGQLRFSVRASMPCTGPALTTGRRAVLVLRRADAAGVLVCDALARGDASPAGTVAWSTELALAAPGPAVTSRGRVYVTGHRGGQALVVAISGRGEVLWERPTPLEPASQLAVAFEQGLLVTDARGGAVRLLADGQPSWVLGGSADQLSRPVAPLLRRGVLVVTGPTVRLVDPTVGRLLAQIETGPHLGDVAVDARFTLYALREPGVLEAFEPGAVLSLVA